MLYTTALMRYDGPISPGSPGSREGISTVITNVSTAKSLPGSKAVEFLTEATPGSQKVHVFIRARRFESPRQYYTKTRVYVSLTGVDLPEPPPYGSTRGDGSDEDKAWKAYNKAEEQAMRNLITAALPALKVWGLVPQDTIATKNTPGHTGTKIAFSRKAGCSMCPCSPGFIVQSNTLGRLDHVPADIWISLPK